MIITDWNGKKVSNGSAFFANYKKITGRAFNRDFKDPDSLDVGEFATDIYVAMRRTADRSLEQADYSIIANEVSTEDVFDTEGKFYNFLISTLLGKKTMEKAEAASHKETVQGSGT